MRTVRFRPEIADDLIEAANWYDEKRTGLGEEFLSEYRIGIGKISERSLSFAKTSTGLRACRLNRFTYVIHFECDDLEIVVYAVMSGWRRSSSWMRRV